MKRRSIISNAPIWSLAIYFLFFSCGDPTTIGTDLFDDEKIDVSFTDTIALQAKSVLRDSFQTLGQTFNGNLLLGNLDDPVFGESKASIFSRVFFVTPPDISVARVRIDSIVLALALYDEINYGDSLDNTISLDVFQVQEDLSSLTEHYETDEIAIDPMRIGSTTDYKLNFDSINVYNPIADSIITEIPQIRIPMNETFVNNFLQIAQESTSDTTFNNSFNGVYVEPTDESGSSTAININNSRFIMYYALNNDSLALYSYSVGLNFFNDFDHDLDGSEYIDQLDDYDKGNEKLYLKSNLNSSVEIDISGISELQGLLINSVELEFTIIEDNVGAIDNYPPIPNLYCSTIDSDGVSIFVKDLEDRRDDANRINIGDASLFFGGNVFSETTLNVRQYKMNITKHIKEALSNTNEDIRPLIIERAILGLPHRSVIYGPGHELYPMKLNVTYTL